MKVLLVATNREQSPYPVAPLGVLCVAATAKAAGHEVEFLDLGLALAPASALQKALEADEFQVVAFGIRNLDNCWAFAPRSYFNGVQELAGIVRHHFKGPLILGGSGFSVSPNGWMPITASLAKVNEPSPNCWRDWKRDNHPKASRVLSSPAKVMFRPLFFPPSRSNDWLNCRCPRTTCAVMPAM